MRKKDIKIGMLVQPSKNKRSGTRFWILKQYIGEVVKFANSMYIEVRWFPVDEKEGKFSGSLSIMKPIDIEPFFE